jgi:hypothetical protein
MRMGDWGKMTMPNPHLPRRRGLDQSPYPEDIADHHLPFLVTSFPFLNPSRNTIRSLDVIKYNHSMHKEAPSRFQMKMVNRPLG